MEMLKGKKKHNLLLQQPQWLIAFKWKAMIHNLAKPILYALRFF